MKRRQAAAASATSTDLRSTSTIRIERFELPRELRESIKQNIEIGRNASAAEKKK